MSDESTIEIPPRTGTSFVLRKGSRLTVIDPKGGQVSDLVACNLHDTNEKLSNGRTLDYASRIYFSTGDSLYSNRSNVMLRIVDDTVGRHDFLLTPCSKEMFRIIYGDPEPHHGCLGNLSRALAPYGVTEDDIPVAFNCFMNVPVKEDGTFTVEPPLSKAGDYMEFVADMDLVVALTACSALQSVRLLGLRGSPRSEVVVRKAGRTKAERDRLLNLTGQTDRYLRVSIWASIFQPDGYPS